MNMWKEPRENEITDTMNRDFIAKGADNYETLEDWRKGEMELRIPSGKDIEFYIGILVTTRICMEWLPDYLGLHQYGPPISMVNSRVCKIINEMSYDKVQEFIDGTNALSI